MQIAGMFLGCLLLGQASDATFAQTPGMHESVGEGLSQFPPQAIQPDAIQQVEPRGMAPLRGSSQVEPASATVPIAAGGAADPNALALIATPGNATQNRRRPPEMVAEAIQLPKGSTISGQPTPLLNVLTSSTDRRQQLEMVRAYWRLTQAVAEYHFCFDHVQVLLRMKSSGDSASLRLALASASAMFHQAEVEATAAQYDLAKLTRLPAGSPLPLPSDYPHVGAYRTNYQELSAMRSTPESAAVLDRVLPLRRQAVDEQATAVQAAEDVLATASERPGNVALAVECSQELLRAQRTFMRIVCDYNRNIAEYGLAVAGPITPPQTLLAMLIGPQTVTPAVARNPAPPANNSPTAAPPAGWRTGQPTPAPSRNNSSQPQPTPASRDERRSAANDRYSMPADEEVRPASNEEPSPATLQGDLQPIGKQEPTLAPLQQPETGAEAGAENVALARADTPGLDLGAVAVFAA